MEKEKDSCVKPAGGPIMAKAGEGQSQNLRTRRKFYANRQGRSSCAGFSKPRLTSTGGLRTSSCRIIKGSGSSCVSIRVISPSSDRPNCRQLPSNTPNSTALGVEVLSVSTDSRFTHKIWQEQELSKMVPGGVPFPMLSDGGGRIGSVYGVYDEDAGVDIRGRFIIDPDGMIQAMEVLTPAVGRNVSELIRQVRGVPACEGHRRGDALRLAARQADPQTRPRSGGQGVDGLETRISL